LSLIKAYKLLKEIIISDNLFAVGKMEKDNKGGEHLPTILESDFDNKNKADIIKNLADIEKLVKAGKLIKEQFAKAFGKVKDFFKQILVKYLPFDLPLFEIPRAQIQPSTGKVLQLPNSYRSHSPPLCCVIK
jgi:hypothetical protein